MKPLLVIAGASGVIGQHFIQQASASYRILKLTRKLGQDKLGQDKLGQDQDKLDQDQDKLDQDKLDQNKTGHDTLNQDLASFTWNPKAVQQNDETSLNNLAQAMSGAKAIINLSGSSISEGRLDKKHQAEVLESRSSSTATLLEACERCEHPPEVFFQASAVGYYGNRGEETLDETSLPQAGNLLSEICVAWEKAAQPAKNLSRLIIGRFGLVIAKDAPAWQRLILPIKLFIGGPLGSGKQWYPWVDADDLAKAVLFLVEHPACQGVYNMTAPEPIRQKNLAHMTAQGLGRPSLIPVPAFALRLALGGVAEALILPSAKVVPTRLEQTGFIFDYPRFEKGLKKWLKSD
jgi:uncharacterized protein